jgi:hypothetical protein
LSADPITAQTILRDADRTEFVRIFWDFCARESHWHPDSAAAAAAVATHLAQHFPDDLNAIEHPFWALLDHLHALLIGYKPELGRAAKRNLDELSAQLPTALDADWDAATAAIAALSQQDRNRQQRIEQRLIDTADGQLRGQRARQQAAQLLNRSMAGKPLPADIAAWMQGEWFSELQWCLLQHGDSGSAWQRRADLTVALVASLQPPSEATGGKQALYEEIPRVGVALRTLLAERAVSAAATEEALGRIEQQHLLLLKGQVPVTAPFRLIPAEDTWFADISLSRDLLARIEALRIGHWFVLRDDGGDRRVKLILKQDEAGQLLFVNQLGIKALQVSVEEFAYRLAAEMALPLPPLSAGRQALLETLALFAERQRIAAEHQRTAEQIRLEEEAALQRRRAEVRERVESEARQRAQARVKAAAEARVLAEAEAQAVALAAEQASLAAQLLEQQARAREQEAHEREQVRRREVVASKGADDNQRQRLARQQAAMLSIGHWVDLHDEKGYLQRLKLAVKLPTSGKLIFVDREGIRRAELSRDQMVASLLDGSAHIADQGAQFEDTLARVVDGLRRDRQWDRHRTETVPGSHDNDDE